jgi:hypothetical protein
VLQIEPTFSEKNDSKIRHTHDSKFVFIKFWYVEVEAKNTHWTFVKLPG